MKIVSLSHGQSVKRRARIVVLYGLSEPSSLKNPRSRDVAFTLRRARWFDRCIATGSATPERILDIDVIALDWNCPKYIPKLYSEDVIRQVVGGQMGQLQIENVALKARIAELEAG